MKVRMTETLATTTITYLMGHVYDIDDKEAKRLVDAGQATKDLSEAAAPKSPLPATSHAPRERQTMDRTPGTPVEAIRPADTTLPSQTAASIERQAHAEVDKHGVPTEEPTGGEANRTEHPGEKTAGVLTTDSGTASRRTVAPKPAAPTGRKGK